MSKQEIEVLSEASNEKQGDVLTKDELVEPPLANFGRKPLDMRQGFPQRCRRLHMGESPGRLLGEACEVLDCPVGLVSLRVMIREPVVGRLEPIDVHLPGLWRPWCEASCDARPRRSRRPPPASAGA